MKTKFILFSILLFLFVNMNAQEYTNGIGLRGGFYSGLTYKRFIKSNVAIEGILDTRWHGFEVVGLYEIQKEINNADGLSWFYGFGGHIGFYDGDYAYWADEGNHTVIGIDGIIGLEYKIPDIPITLGLDWKPAFDVFGNSRFFADGGAFTIRYIFD